MSYRDTCSVCISLSSFCLSAFHSIEHFEKRQRNSFSDSKNWTNLYIAVHRMTKLNCEVHQNNAHQDPNLNGTQRQNYIHVNERRTIQGETVFSTQLRKCAKFDNDFWLGVAFKDIWSLSFSRNLSSGHNLSMQWPSIDEIGIVQVLITVRSNKAKIAPCFQVRSSLLSQSANECLNTFKFHFPSVVRNQCFQHLCIADTTRSLLS